MPDYLSLPEGQLRLYREEEELQVSDLLRGRRTRTLLRLSVSARQWPAMALRHGGCRRNGVWFEGLLCLLT